MGKGCAWADAQAQPFPGRARLAARSRVWGAGEWPRLAQSASGVYGNLRRGGGGQGAAAPAGEQTEGVALCEAGGQLLGLQSRASAIGDSGIHQILAMPHAQS